MRVTFLGFTLTDEEMALLLQEDTSMPVQTHVFAWNIVDALRAGGASVRLLSSEPASNYPSNSRIVFRGGHFVAREVGGERLSFINLLALKHVSRFFACLGSGVRALRFWCPHVLLIHGVHSPYLWFGVIVRNLTKIRVVVVLTDPPGVNLPADSLVVRLMKRLDVWVVREALSRVDGVIALTSPLASDFARGMPHIVVEGISAANRRRSQIAQTSHPGFRVLYAGSLSSSSGIDRLVTAVRCIAVPNIRLSTYGRGPEAEQIDRHGRVDPRIDAVRYAGREDVVAEYSAVDLLVQPRPTAETFTPYSFPSKLLEYMSSGTPVLSTRLPGIPVEYEQYLYWIEDDSVDGIRSALERVMRLDGQERRAKGRAASDFVHMSRSVEAQGLRIVDFLNLVCNE